MKTNEEDNSNSGKIEEAISNAKQLEVQKRWLDASEKYRSVLGMIKQSSDKPINPGSGSNVVEQEQAVDCLIGFHHCKLQLSEAADPGILEYDSSKRVRQGVKKLEKELKSYPIKKSRLWNILQYTYDQWGEEQRNAGLKYEADEYQYHMLKARMKWMWGRAIAPRESRNVGVWMEFVVSFVRTFIEWALYWVGKGLFYPFLFFVGIPILLSSFIYFGTECIVVDGMNVQPAGFLRWLYSLSYSVFVFTGSEAGPVRACSNHPGVILAMAGEAIFGLVFMVVIVGYLVNRLSSR